MNEYILEVILFQLAFLLIYEFWLQKETFFNLNRAYLLSTPLLSFLIPFIRIESLQQSSPAIAFQHITDKTMVLLPEVYIGKNQSVAAQVAETDSLLNWWFYIYLLGAVISLGIFLYKLYKLEKISKNSRPVHHKHIEIREIPNSTEAFTYSSKLFIGDQITSEERQQIITHELVHLDEKHGFDLMLFEVLKIAFWFNPLVYLFQSRLATLHEYIADETTVRKSGKKQYFEQLLNTAFGTSNISFTNQFFSHSLIKKRIVMLQKNKSGKLKHFKFLLLIPALLLMLTYVACSEDQPMDNQFSGSDLDQQMEQMLETLKNKESLSKTERDLYLYLLKRKEEGSLNSKTDQIKNKVGNADDTLVPYAVIDRAPAFPGCDNWENDVRKNCTTSKISEFVSTNFNTDIGKQLGLTGISRVMVQFTINNEGNIQDVRARASKPQLEEEAIRVIQSLPKMAPGEQDGLPVNVVYALPIAFKVSE